MIKFNYKAYSSYYIAVFGGFREECMGYTGPEKKSVARECNAEKNNFLANTFYPKVDKYLL